MVVSPLTSRMPPRRSPAQRARQLKAVSRFEAMSPRDKAEKSLGMALGALPNALRSLWDHRHQVLAGVSAPYLHPLGSLEKANRAVAASWAEGPAEAMLTAVKLHGNLAVAWLFPVSVILAPTTGGAALAVLGAAGLAATSASAAKNLLDASRAESEAALAAQSQQLLADTLDLIPNALMMGVSHLAMPAKGMDDFMDDALRAGMADDLADAALDASRTAAHARRQVIDVVDHVAGQTDKDHYQRSEAARYKALLERLN